MSFNLPEKTPVTVYNLVGEGLVVYKTATPVDVTSTGVKNIMQLPADRGDFVWTGIVIRPTNVSGSGTPAAVTIGWGGSPTQIVSAGVSITPTAAGSNRIVPSTGTYFAVIPDNEQLQVDVTTATTGYTAYEVDFEILGYHV